MSEENEPTFTVVQSNIFSMKPSMSPSIDKLGASLAKANAKIEGAPKDSSNPFFKSKYADLASNIDATREAYGAHGLTIVQTPFSDEGKHYINTLLIHESGQWISSGALEIIGNYESNKDSQKFLAALTYLRRGQFAAVCRLAQIDDDGNTANDRPSNPQAPQSNPQRPVQAAPPRPQAPQAQAQKPVTRAPQGPPARPEGVKNYAEHLPLSPEDKEKLARVTGAIKDAKSNK